MKLIICFPGIGYNCDKPLLYYGRDIACECGYEECINISYVCNVKNIRGNAVLMREAFEQLYAQAEKQLENVDFKMYEEILFVSKSIGTVVAAAYAKRKGLNNNLRQCVAGSEAVKLRNIFFTPLELTFEFEPQNGISFTGTLDPWVEYEIVEKGCKKAGLPLFVIENANHSLEVADVMVNIENIKEIMMHTKNYIVKK